MPTYLFLNKNTNEEYELSMSISERETYLKDNPHVEQLVNGFPGVADPSRMGLHKPDSSFRDVLKKIKSKHHKSNINTW